MKKRKRYFIPILLLDKLAWDRIWWSRNKRLLRLYNKNGFCWQTFFNVKPVKTHFAYQGETCKLDSHWQNSIPEILPPQ